MLETELIDFIKSNKIQVFPLVFGDKTPKCKWKNFEFDQGLQNLSDLMTSPKNTYAIRCGKISNLFVVDIDISKSITEINGIELIKKLNLNINDYFCVDTPSGGFHLYFEYEGYLSMLRPGTKIRHDGMIYSIDIRTDDSYVVGLFSWSSSRQKIYSFNLNGSNKFNKIPLELSKILIQNQFEKRDVMPIVRINSENNENEHKKVSLSNVETKTPKRIYDGKITVELVENVIFGLHPERYNDYEKWIRVIFAIKSSLGEKGRCLTHLYSSQSKEKYNKKITDKVFDSSNGSVTFGSLMFWLLSDNSQRYKELFGKESISMNYNQIIQFISDESSDDVSDRMVISALFNLSSSELVEYFYNYLKEIKEYILFCDDVWVVYNKHVGIFAKYRSEDHCKSLHDCFDKFYFKYMCMIEKTRVYRCCGNLLNSHLKKINEWKFKHRTSLFNLLQHMYFDTSIMTNMDHVEPHRIVCGSYTIDLLKFSNGSDYSDVFMGHSPKNYISRKTEIVPEIFDDLKQDNFFEVMMVKSRGFRLMHTFICSIMNEEKNAILNLQSILGYFLISGNPERNIFIFIGTKGSNGKSLLVEILNKVLGMYVVAGEKETILLNKFSNSGGATHGLLKHFGPRLTVYSELTKDSSFNQATLKSLSGTDAVFLRKMYKESSDYPLIPTSKILMVTNELPEMSFDLAFMERIICINFPIKFVDVRMNEKLGFFQKVKNPNLRRDILSSESLSGVLSYLLYCNSIYINNGIVSSESNLDLKRISEKSTLRFGDFILECIRPNIQNETKMSQIKDRYLLWCSENNEVPVEIKRNKFDRIGFELIEQASVLNIEITRKIIKRVIFYCVDLI